MTMRASASSSSLASGANSDRNVRVFCRVRPQNTKELEMAGATRSVFVTGDQLDVKTADGGQTYTYDHVFDDTDNQQVVFDNVARPVVQDIMDGYNATIFAYGQTSSGKTYTMEGASIDDAELRGIIPRTATEIFQNVYAADENIEFIVKVSYIEIYMERIRDLLDPYKSQVNLQVREDTQRGIFVEGMTELSVTSDEELLSTMRNGAANRAVAATGMNEGSSRSHSVFMVTLYQRNLANQATKAGKLYLVDLAGSEMVRKTGASGKQLEEAKTINKSLSALGNVINALTDAGASHVPYRDSKLTRVLQESLGGNSKTALIINVSPSSYNTMETISTLRFGNRAKAIKNKAVVNEQRSVEEYKALLAKADKVIQSQQTYIISLEARLGADRKKDHTGPTADQRAGTPPLSAPASSPASNQRKRQQQQNKAKASMKNVTDRRGDRSSRNCRSETSLGLKATAALADQEVGALTDTEEIGLDVQSDDGSETPTERERSVSTIGAAQALEELQERVAQLEEELNEEKAESTRRAQEIRFLMAKGEDQANALETTQLAADEYRKARELQEKSLDDKARQSETQYVEIRAEFDRLNFEHQELLIHADKVQREYDTLLQDMAANAATAAPVAVIPPESPRSLPVSPHSNGTITVATQEGDGASMRADGTVSDVVVAANGANATNGVNAIDASETTAAGAATPVTTEAEASSLPSEPSAAAESANVASDATSAEPTAGESSKESVDLHARCQVLEDELQQYEKEYRVLLATTEREKGRLVEDLERKIIQIRELENQVSNGNGGAGVFTSGSGMSARERQHMRSIQQKLEQLVAVHRQLLRKYASLELELAEAKKKIVLRDDRIKQVEANNRIMAGNMRAQAEKHVEELTHLRDQIADFRGAQRSHFESQLSQNSDSNAIKTLRGGSFYSEGVIRPIRGGGRRKLSGGGSATTTNGGNSNGTTVASAQSNATSDSLWESSLQTSEVASPTSRSDSTAPPSSGFLTRFFGGKAT